MGFRRPSVSDHKKFHVQQSKTVERGKDTSHLRHLLWIYRKYVTRAKAYIGITRKLAFALSAGGARVDIAWPMKAILVYINCNFAYYIIFKKLKKIEDYYGR